MPSPARIPGQQFAQLHHEHANRDSSQSQSDVTPRSCFFGSELRQHVWHAADRARDGDREEHHVEGELVKRWVKFLSAVEVEKIAECLKRPERDP
jgi:hypothetical protein